MRDDMRDDMRGSVYDEGRAGAVFKEVLSLIIAQRRPSELLGERPDRLSELTDSYIRILAREGALPPVTACLARGVVQTGSRLA